MSKNILIIGASRGIGLELCRQYTEQGHSVTATCRKATQALSSLDCEIIENVEVSDDQSVSDMVKALAGKSIDIVIHNSGILRSDSYPNVDFDNMREHFEINTLGPLRTIQAIEPLLKEGSKVGIMSSRVGSIADNTSSNNYAYRVSKTAVNMVGKCLSIDLAAKGIALAMLHPGYVKTDMTHHNGLINADESAAGLIQRMDELDMNTSGSFVHTSGERLTW